MAIGAALLIVAWPVGVAVAGFGGFKFWQHSGIAAQKEKAMQELEARYQEQVAHGLETIRAAAASWDGVKQNVEKTRGMLELDRVA